MLFKAVAAQLTRVGRVSQVDFVLFHWRGITGQGFNSFYDYSLGAQLHRITQFNGIS